MQRPHHGTQDRQWDMRINVQTDDYLTGITERIMDQFGTGKLKYILIGGLEIGTKPTHSDYKTRHVHICAIFNNPISMSAIIKNFGIVEGNGYYLVPRNRDLPYAGWRDHHIKEYSKIDKTKTIIYEAGELPRDQKEATKRSAEEKKRKLDDILIEMKQNLTDGVSDDIIFAKFPRTYLQYGEKMKTMVKQKADYAKQKGDPHIWVYGYPGTGKTAIMRFIYTKMYKKDLQNRFFDLYDDKVHTHIMLEDLDHQNMEKLGIQFLKTICDEAGFPIDQKYKTPQLTRSTILVTSNFQIWEVVPEGKGDRLKREGNDNPKEVFMTWDYLMDAPKGMPLEEPEYYQELIRNAFYRR
jgi:hypothetical protein